MKRHLVAPLVRSQLPARTARRFGSAPVVDVVDVVWMARVVECSDAVVQRAKTLLLTPPPPPPPPPRHATFQHNGWKFLVPIMQNRLDQSITTHKCVIREASYTDDGRLRVDSLSGANVLIPAMSPLTSRELDAAGQGVRLVYQPAVDTSLISRSALRDRGIPACYSPGCNANAGEGEVRRPSPAPPSPPTPTRSS